MIVWLKKVVNVVLVRQFRSSDAIEVEVKHVSERLFSETILQIYRYARPLPDKFITLLGRLLHLHLGFSGFSSMQSLSIQ